MSFSWDPDFAAGSRVMDIALVADDGSRVGLYDNGTKWRGAGGNFGRHLELSRAGRRQLSHQGQWRKLPLSARQGGGGYTLSQSVPETLDYSAAATTQQYSTASTPISAEQGVFQAYMKAAFTGASTAFDQADTPAALDERIQNLNTRAESVLQPSQLALSKVGAFSTNVYNAGGAEIVGYDPTSKRMFMVNAVAAEIQVLNMSDPANPVLAGKLDFKSYATTAGSTPQVNSVAVSNGTVAVALADANPTAAGKVVLFKADVAVSSTAARLPARVPWKPAWARIW